MVRIGSKGQFVVTAFSILIFAIVVGYVISSRFGYNLIATISTVFTAGILLAGIYPAFFAEESSSSENTNAVSERNTSSSSSESGSSQQIGPTTGLRPEQKQIQNELIRAAYDRFEKNPFSFAVTPQAHRLVDDVSDRLDVNQSDVSEVWKFCKDDGFFRKLGNAWRITPKAVFRAEELGIEIELDDAIQEEILDNLLQEYRNDPHRSLVSQDTLLDVISESRKTVLQNLWYLSEKRYVEREAYLGGGANYEITDLGRRVLE